METNKEKGQIVPLPGTPEWNLVTRDVSHHADVPNRHRYAVSELIPQGIRESIGDLLVRLLEYYYEYQATGDGADRKLSELYTLKNADSYQYSQDILDHLYDEFATLVPHKKIIENPAVFLKHAISFYQQKGSNESIEAFFNVFFGEKIFLKNPWDDVLIASGGQWKSLYFFDIEPIFLASPDVNLSRLFEIATSTETIHQIQVRLRRTGEFISCDSFEFNQDRIRVTLSNHVIAMSLLEGDVIELIDLSTSDNDVIARGQIIPSLSDVKIVTGGRDWQPGQIFVLNGDIRNTICRVREVGRDGSIESVEILQHGIGHCLESNYVINSYSVEPEIPSDSIVRRETSVHPSQLFFAHVIEIDDSGFNVFDSLDGRRNEDRPDHSIRDLFCSERVSSNGKVNQNKDYSGNIDWSEWIQSKAVVSLVGGVCNRQHAFYKSDASLLSTGHSVLQDADYYQKFAYDIRSEIHYDEYDYLIDRNVHPAGIKRFSTYLIPAYDDPSIGVSIQESEMLVGDFFILDVANQLDDHLKRFTKIREDDVTVDEERPQKNVTKRGVISHMYGVVDSGRSDVEEYDVNADADVRFSAIREPIDVLTVDFDSSDSPYNSPVYGDKEPRHKKVRLGIDYYDRVWGLSADSDHTTNAFIPYSQKNRLSCDSHYYTAGMDYINTYFCSKYSDSLCITTDVDDQHSLYDEIRFTIPPFDIRDKNYEIDSSFNPDHNMIRHRTQLLFDIVKSKEISFDRSLSINNLTDQINPSEAGFNTSLILNQYTSVSTDESLVRSIDVNLSDTVRPDEGPYVNDDYHVDEYVIGNYLQKFITTTLASSVTPSEEGYTSDEYSIESYTTSGFDIF